MTTFGPSHNCHQTINVRGCFLDGYYTVVMYRQGDDRGTRPGADFPATLFRFEKRKNGVAVDALHDQPLMQLVNRLREAADVQGWRTGDIGARPARRLPDTSAIKSGDVATGTKKAPKARCAYIYSGRQTCSPEFAGAERDCIPTKEMSRP
jgi:hypothetical protein